MRPLPPTCKVTHTHLFGTDQLVVSELHKLGPQCLVAVDEERLPTSDVQVMERHPWQRIKQETTNEAINESAD